MGRSQREKGKAGEREFSKVFAAETGLTCRRTQQFAGRQGTSDVMVAELPDLHIEVKYGARPPILSAMRQAVDDKRSEQFPLVASRQVSLTERGREWLVTCRLGDLVEIARQLTEAVK